MGFKTDLHDSIQFIQEPKLLREKVSNLHKKYVPNGIKKQELDADIQREYNRQRDYLEKSVESLKRKLIKDSDVHRQDNTRILQENVALIREINELRREIDYLKKERQQQRLNVSKLKGQNNTAARSAGATNDLAGQREIEQNKSTIDQLRRKIEEQISLRETAAAQLSMSAAEVEEYARPAE